MAAISGQSVSGGRVRVDYNHPLAGKDLRYRLRIVRQITKSLEKAKALLEYYNVDCKTSIRDGKLAIETKKPLHALIQKMIDETTRKWIKEIKTVNFKTRQEPAAAKKSGGKEKKPI